MNLPASRVVLNFMYSVWQDLRYSLRAIRQSPGFAVAAILSLALGIGANTAIFTLINAAFLRTPDGIRSPETLAAVWTRAQGRNGYGNVSYPNYRDTRSQTADIFEGLACSSMVPLDSKAGGETSRLTGMTVSGNFFDVLGTRMELGRGFAATEDQVPGRDAVAVISHGLWQRRFGGSRDAIGRTIVLNGHPFSVIGVAEKGFHGLYPIGIDVWVPMMMSAQVLPQREAPFEKRGMSYLHVVGRLRPGITLAQVRAKLEVVSRNLAAAHPREWRDFLNNKPRYYTAVEGSKSYMPPEVRTGFAAFLAILMVVVGLVLLIACVNVANLLLARSAARGKEIAIRLSLGAGRWRLLRQLLTENLLLALAGGALALALASWAADLLLAIKPPLDVPLVVDLSFDARVFGFTFAIALATAVLFGLAPSLALTRPDLAPSLKEAGSSTTASFRRFGIRNILLATQAALSMLLLVGSGLFLRSLGNAHSIDIGFNARNVVTVPIDMSRRPYKEEQGRAAHSRILEAVRSAPGVKSADIMRITPLSMNESAEPFVIEGEPAQAGGRRIVATNFVGPHFFEALEVPLVAGRTFRETDRRGAPRVIVVNQEFAARYLGGQNAIGKRIALTEDPKDAEWLEIVGIAKTGKYNTLGEDPTPFVYVPYEQEYMAEMALAVRTEQPAGAALAGIRSLLRRADPDLPLDGLMTMEESIAAVLLPARLGGLLLGAFGVLALALAGIGLYGVMAYLVSQRTREVGIRMALGARPREVMSMVLRRGMGVALTGMAIGTLAAAGLTRFAASMLYGLSPTDPATFIGVFALLALVAFGACLVPARRAARVDPLVALRHE